MFSVKILTANPEMFPGVLNYSIIGKALKERTVSQKKSKVNSKPIVIFESTVYPGATEEIAIPILESISGMKIIKDWLEIESGCTKIH